MMLAVSWRHGQGLGTQCCSIVLNRYIQGRMCYRRNTWDHTGYTITFGYIYQSKFYIMLLLVYNSCIFFLKSPVRYLITSKATQTYKQRTKNATLEKQCFKGWKQRGTKFYWIKKKILPFFIHYLNYSRKHSVRIFYALIWH